MLVLSRHKNEKIMIGENIVVTIMDIRGDQVRIGIDAPRDMGIDRLEIREAKQRKALANQDKAVQRYTEETKEGLSESE